MSNIYFGISPYQLPLEALEIEKRACEATLLSPQRKMYREGDPSVVIPESPFNKTTDGILTEIFFFDKMFFLACRYLQVVDQLCMLHEEQIDYFEISAHDFVGDYKPTSHEKNRSSRLFRSKGYKKRLIGQNRTDFELSPHEDKRYSILTFQQAARFASNTQTKEDIIALEKVKSEVRKRVTRSITLGTRDHHKIDEEGYQTLAKLVSSPDYEGPEGFSELRDFSLIHPNKTTNSLEVPYSSGRTIKVLDRTQYGEI